MWIMKSDCIFSISSYINFLYAVFSRFCWSSSVEHLVLKPFYRSIHRCDTLLMYFSVRARSDSCCTRTPAGRQSGPLSCSHFPEFSKRWLRLWLKKDRNLLFKQSKSSLLSLTSVLSFASLINISSQQLCGFFYILYTTQNETIMYFF